MLINIFFVLLLIGISSFFVIVEYATVSARKTRIALFAKEGSQSAKIILSWLEDPKKKERVIAASQVGITMAGLALGAIGEDIFIEITKKLLDSISFPFYIDYSSPIFHLIPLVVGLIIMTSFSVVIGELVPKVITLRHPEEASLHTARVMNWFIWLFYPLVLIFEKAARLVLKIFRIDINQEPLALSIEELKQVLEESEEKGIIKAPQKDMLNAIFELEDMLVRQVLIPRTEIVALEANETVADAMQTISMYPYTKYPVFEENLDQIIGILHVKDLFKVIQEPNEWKTLFVRDFAREAIFVPDSIPVKLLLNEFRVKQQHIAIVMDEFGGTSGLVTLEDLLEEIVGEVSDPFDNINPEIQMLSENTYQIEGLTRLEEVNEALGLNLQDENYDTIAGYILSKLGRIAQEHDVVQTDGIRLEVLKMDGMRIDKILLTLLADQ